MFWKDQNEEHKRLAGYCWSILKGINRINRSFEAERLKQSSDGKVLTHYLTGFQPKTLAKVGSLSRKLNCPKIFPNFVKSLTCTFYCQHSNDFTWLFLFRQNNNRCCWCHCGCCCWCRHGRRRAGRIAPAQAQHAAPVQHARPRGCDR